MPGDRLVDPAHHLDVLLRHRPRSISRRGRAYLRSIPVIERGTGTQPAPSLATVDIRLRRVGGRQRRADGRDLARLGADRNGFDGLVAVGAHNALPVILGIRVALLDL
jgi:hypothetical protein